MTSTPTATRSTVAENTDGTLGDRRRAPPPSAPTRPSPATSDRDTFTYTIVDGFGGSDQAPVGHRPGVTDHRHRPPRDAHHRARGTTIPLADIPYERMRELDVDVSNSRSPAAIARLAGGRRVHLSPAVPPNRFAPFTRWSLTRRSHAAVGDPGRLPRWVAGRPEGTAARRPTHPEPSRSANCWRCATSSSRPPTRRGDDARRVVLLRRHGVSPSAPAAPTRSAH